MDDVPSTYKTAGTLMMASGFANIGFALLAEIIIFMYASATMLATFGLGIVCYACMLWPIVQAVMGLVEVIVGAQAMGGKRMSSMRAVSVIACVVSAMNIAMIPLILEVVVMVQLNDKDATAYLEDRFY